MSAGTAKDEEYKYDDDLENLIFQQDKNEPKNENESVKFGDNKSEKERTHQSDQLLLMNNQKEDKFFICKKIFNIISICSIIFLLSIFLIYCLTSRNLKVFYNYFKPKILHLQTSFEMFVTIWVIILSKLKKNLYIKLTLFTINLVTFIISLFRNLFLFTSDPQEVREINDIISFNLKHYFYLGNIFITLSLALWNNKLCVNYCITLFLSFLSSLFYFLTYLKIKDRKYISGFLSKCGFSMTISFLLSWSNCLFFINLFLCLENFDYFSLNVIELLAFITHCFIFCFSILLLVFYQDIFYIIIILIFQLGIVISNKSQYSKDNKYTLIYAIMTSFSFIFYLSCTGRIYEEEKLDLEKKYEEERVRADIL